MRYIIYYMCVPTKVIVEKLTRRNHRLDYAPPRSTVDSVSRKSQSFNDASCHDFRLSA